MSNRVKTIIIFLLIVILGILLLLPIPNTEAKSTGSHSVSHSNSSKSTTNRIQHSTQSRISQTRALNSHRDYPKNNAYHQHNMFYNNAMLFVVLNSTHSSTQALNKEKKQKTLYILHVKKGNKTYKVPVSKEQYDKAQVGKEITVKLQ